MDWCRFRKGSISNRLTFYITSKHAPRVFFVICAGAKRDFSQSGIFGAMDTHPFQIQLTVEEVLRKWPNAFSVFIKKKTKCPGCLMEHFCTLKDVAETYQFLLEELMAEIENASV